MRAVSGSDSPSPKPPSSREKGLIAMARRQVEHRGESSKPQPNEGLPQAFPGLDVVREIHRGGQGVVYQAIQRATKRKVAIKVFHEGPFAGARDRARFEREVEILAQLDHPNIVGIIDRGTTDNGSYFFVMDYVSGKPLDVFMADSGRTIEEMLRLFAKICDAVNAAHLKGIIHRDLKPSNIRIDQAGEPHILDFGLAKILTGEVLNDPEARLMTMTGQFIGSLPWASPEQASGAGSNVDIRADVYSLGVILYQLITGGRFPYTVIGAMRDVLDNIMRAEPARPSTIRRQINDEVETIVLKTLAKDRERRYQSAGDLARDVRRYLNGEPIEAKRDSGWYLLHKTVRRHKGPVAVAAGFILLLAASSIITGFLYSRASAARDDAQAGHAAAVAARDEENRQRRNAEGNLRAVREMAQTFIFEFNRDIAPLRGATRARERLLTRALEYLARVKDQAAADPAFLRELADAYEKVGDIQAGLFRPNVGGSLSADGSFAEAKRLREQALQLEPDNAQLIAEHAQSMKRTAEALRRQKKHAEAADELDRAASRMDDAIKRIAPADNNLLRRCSDQRMWIIMDRADALRAAARGAAEDNPSIDAFRRAYDDAIDYWSRRVEQTPTDPEASNGLGAAHTQRAAGEFDTAQARRAASAPPKKAGKRDEALAVVKSSMPIYQRSIDAATAGRSILDALANRHPASATYRRDAALALHNAGQAKMFLAYAWEDAADLSEGEDKARAAAQQDRLLREALADFKSALASAESLWSSDESNLEAQRNVALYLNKVGTVLIDLKQWSDSAAALDRSISIRDEIFRTDATNIHRADLAQALCKRALLDRIRLDAGAVVPADRPALIRSALEGFQRGLAHLEALRNDGVMSEKDAEYLNATRAIEACTAMMQRENASP